VDGVTLVFRDVTSLRALTAERLDLPARLLEAEDRERARIAADVHEDSVQAIGVVSLHLQLLSAHLHQPSVKVESLLAELNTYVTSATERLRSLLFSLEPTDANTPIARSIRIQAAYVFEGSTIHWSVDDLDGGEELPQAARSQALRITKEALSNVRAHSKASEVIVTLTGDDESLEVLIADNGETIDPAAFTSAPGHRGLATMQDRAIAVGGWCVIEPSEPHGCSVRFHLPRLGPTAH
jgi:signal transduction histidine kinase